MKIRERLRAIKAELKALFSHSIYDAAKFNGLAIEYLNGMPSKYDGHLDPDETPRYISVNPALPQVEQIYIIAREIGRYAQLRRCDSPFIDRRWKWDLLATAPTQTSDFIYRLDIEIRAYCILMWHTDRNTFLDFSKRHPKSRRLVWFSTAISEFVFFKLRIRAYLCRIRSAFALAKAF